MNENYVLPIGGDWTTQDIIIVTNFINSVLGVYEKGSSREEVLKNYDAYRKIMPAKSEQKKFDKDFERQTGYSIYKTIKFVQNSTKDRVRL
ncbi:UPF0223 family protein [Leuconostoc mesenteroides]|uniref:UPF0223 family protein n=1 Tax=Leuconostoc mesenteroides TaxID=1245 RepID=UPI001C243E47|nr:UPF0223 family protein [Leuconostoc mesenteroides]QXC53370.1 UPF0223 family protein [Leuconostoc mesenteroides]USI45123.1 UPF0223 family protein [Leuconostoc mesenteroides]